MPVTIEYLAIFRRTDTFCDNSASFIRLLQVDSEIRIKDGTIFHQNRPSCAFRLADGEIAGKQQRYFHLHFAWDGDPAASPDDLNEFLGLLKKIRGMIAQAGGQTESLRDDLTSHFASRAYPLIHEIENLMRRLIANFMLVTVGLEWVQETLPKGVEEAVRQSKRKDYLNVLHSVDFIHLGDFLFSPYSKRSAQELVDSIRDVKSMEDLHQLQQFVPMSNWQRYFRGLVGCDDSFLKSRWEKLYELRCTVAHNAPMTSRELEDIEKLIREIKPKLLEAVEKISNVSVPAEEAESVAESAASSVNTTLGEFLTWWKRLESALAIRIGWADGDTRTVPSHRTVLQLGLLSAAKAETYDRLRAMRNSIVHGPQAVPQVDAVHSAVAQLQDLVSLVESFTYIDYLRSLTPEERRSSIESKIDETRDEIAMADDFSGAIASTNASNWTIDNYEIEDIELDDENGTCEVRLLYYASGEQDEDRMYSGTKLSGSAIAVIDEAGNLEYNDVTAGVDPVERDEDDC